VNAGNIQDSLRIADGVIMSSAFKPKSGFTRETMMMDWDEGKIREVMGKVSL